MDADSLNSGFMGARGSILGEKKRRETSNYIDISYDSTHLNLKQNLERK